MSATRTIATTTASSGPAPDQSTSPARTPQIPAACTLTIPFPPGTTLASLPAREDGPLGSPRQRALLQLLTHNPKLFSTFDPFYALDRTIRRLFSLPGVTPSKSADDAMYDAGSTHHSTDGSGGAKEAATRRVLADTVVEASVLVLRRFPDLPFVILPEPSSDSSRVRASSPTSSGPATKRPRQSQTSALKKTAAASLPSTRSSPETFSTSRRHGHDLRWPCPFLRWLKLRIRLEVW